MSARMDGHSLVNILRAIGSVPKNRARQFKPNNPILQHFNSRTVTFALPTFSPGHALVIRTIEFLTGKIRLLWLARKFLSTRRALDGTMWERLLDFLEIEIVTPNAEIAQIPATGPVVVVANHPFGFVDGLVLGALVSQVRPDLKILTRAFRGIPPEVRENMVPVAHSHNVDFTARNIAVRKEVMKHLNAGGAVILFPAGRVATSKSPFGRAIEYSWTPFTAKMIPCLSGCHPHPLYVWRGVEWPGRGTKRGWMSRSVKTFRFRGRFLSSSDFSRMARPVPPNLLAMSPLPLTPSFTRAIGSTLDVVGVGDNRIGTDDTSQRRHRRAGLFPRAKQPSVPNCTNDFAGAPPVAAHARDYDEDRQTNTSNSGTSDRTHRN